MACAAATGGSGAGNRLKVTLTEPFSFITPLISNFFSGGLNITSSATVTVIGLAPDPIDTNPDGCDARRARPF